MQDMVVKHHGMVLKWQDLLVYCHDIKYHDSILTSQYDILV